MKLSELKTDDMGGGFEGDGTREFAIYEKQWLSAAFRQEFAD